MCRCGPNHNNKRPVVRFASRFKKLWSKPIIRLLLMFLQGARLRRHRRGGPVQPAGEEDRLPEPQPHQHAQLLQLQQQHGQPEQPTPARPGCLQRPHVRVHVSERKTSAREVSEFHVIFTILLSLLSLFSQEPDSSVRGKSTVRERASDRTRLSTPFGALGPRGQDLPMMSLPSVLTNRFSL